ncbi:MAG: DNA cytosine methyltransferase [Kiritimatiellia bacterium]|jgi:DNA (cytosine-5)-methyltransferase 1
MKQKNTTKSTNTSRSQVVREEVNFFPVSDFFAGSGLVTEGLSDCFSVVWANDICERKAKVYQANHGQAHFLTGPIQQVRGSDLPETVMSWASFPCQDLSLAGNMVGIKSARSGLVWEWLRVLDECDTLPPVLVAENVIGLISAHGGKNYLQLHNALRQRGYSVGAIILDAVDWVPQSRPRVFVIAFSTQFEIPARLQSSEPLWCHTDAIKNVAGKCQDWVWWNLPKPYPRRKGLSDILEWGAPVDPPDKRDNLFAMIPPSHRKELFSVSKPGASVFPGYRRTRNGKQVLELRFDNVAGCLRTPEGGSSRQIVVIHDKNGMLNTRLLTVRETARLMGAPDSYHLPGSYNDGYKAMGDAVAVPVVKWLARHLLNPLCNIASKKELYCVQVQ